MEIFELVIEQIKSVYPAAKTHHNVPKKEPRLTLELSKFGKIGLNQTFDISITYLNLYSTDFKSFKAFFEPRLNLEGSQAYIYEDSIIIYKRSIESSDNFQYALKRAEIFINAVKSIERFVHWNETLNAKRND